MIVKWINRSTQALQKVYKRFIFDQSLCALCGVALKNAALDKAGLEKAVLENNVDSGITALAHSAGSYSLPVCAGCLHWLAPIKTPCLQCALPMTHAGALCGRCIRNPPHFDQVVAGCLYQGPIQTLALQQKRGNRAALKLLLHALEHALMPVWAQQAVTTQPSSHAANPIQLFPIPTPWNRWLIRGFNPTHELAWQFIKGILQPWSIPYQIHWRALQANVHPPQKRQTHNQRLTLAKQLFSWQKPQDLSGRHCVLLDDVMTTGATLMACATLLKQQGAARVDAWVLCRTPKK